MSEFGWPLQVALVDALVAENICDGRIYEDVPKGITYPYVRLSEISSNRNDVTDVDRAVEQVTLHIHTKGDNAKRDALVLSGQITKIFLYSSIVIGDETDCLFDVLGGTGRKDIENGEFIQNLRISAQLSKA